MTSDDLLFLMDYHIRANNRILEVAQELTPAQLTALASLDHKDALHTLMHMMDVDWSWREMCCCGAVGDQYLWQEVPLDTLTDLRAFWSEERERLREYVAGLDADALVQTVSFGKDHELSAPVWQVMAHVVNHGTQHRSELARHFTMLGHSPGDLDML